LIDAGLHAKRGRPLEGDDVLLRCIPWLVAGLLAFSFLALLPDRLNWANLVSVGLLVPVILASVPLVRWERLPYWVQAIPPMLPLLMVLLIRSTHDSPVAAYTPAVLLPVFWFALYGTRGQLLFVIGAVAAIFSLPTPAVSGYPATVPAAGFLWATIAGAAGFTVSELVRQREGLQAEMAQVARTDSLTGLPNRRAWDEALERELALADRSGSPVCAALLDLDRFKEFNDLNGHPAGDTHLKEAASMWRSRLRSADLIARYGGEEFAVLLTATGSREAFDVIETLRGCVPRDETVSAGVAQWDGVETGIELFARADRALYEAKRGGRDRTIEAASGSALLQA
jgi:diguanylate cyclase (GGDEF)-like protein